MDIKPLYKTAFLLIVLGTYATLSTINAFAALRKKVVRYALKYYRLSSF